MYKSFYEKLLKNQKNDKWNTEPSEQQMQILINKLQPVPLD